MKTLSVRRRANATSFLERKRRKKKKRTRPGESSEKEEKFKARKKEGKKDSSPSSPSLPNGCNIFSSFPSFPTWSMFSFSLSLSLLPLSLSASAVRPLFLLSVGPSQRKILHTFSSSPEVRGGKWKNAAWISEWEKKVKKKKRGKNENDRREGFFHESYDCFYPSGPMKQSVRDRF